MLIRNQLLACLLFALLPTAVLACSCARSMGFCQALPDSGNADHAVFVGKVTGFYPKSRGEMTPLVEEFVHALPGTVVRGQTNPRSDFRQPWPVWV
jgi:hypothetical protein